MDGGTRPPGNAPGPGLVPGPGLLPGAGLVPGAVAGVTPPGGGELPVAEGTIISTEDSSSHAGGGGGGEGRGRWVLNSCQHT